MGVKTIFKTLVGTMVVIVVTSMIMEYINISTSAAQMKGIMMRSISKACDYVIQETYKTGGVGNVVGNMSDIEGRGGTIAGSGKFYEGSDSKSVYNKIYRSNEFNNFMSEKAGTWRNLDTLFYGLNGGEVAGGNRLTEDEKSFGKAYAESYTTASNLGVPYLDRDVLERVMKFNLIDTLSNGNKENVYNDTSTSSYVLFRGFKIYYEHINIDGIEYTVYNIANADEKEDFERLTNIDTDDLMLEGDKLKICVASIDYRIKINYSGVSPLKKIMQYLWNMEVDGLSGNDSIITSNTFNENNVSTLTQDSVSGEMPVDGNIIYYIVN